MGVRVPTIVLLFACAALETVGLAALIDFIHQRVQDYRFPRLAGEGHDGG
jgi:hypothetical protein